MLRRNLIQVLEKCRDGGVIGRIDLTDDLKNDIC
jgi:hypothetical protein